MKKSKGESMADVAVGFFLLFVVALLLFVAGMGKAHANDYPWKKESESVRQETKVETYSHATAVGEAYSSSHSKSDSTAMGGNAYSEGGAGGHGGKGGEGGDGGDASQTQQAQGGEANNEGNQQTTKLNFEDSANSAAPIFAGMCSSGASYQEKKMGFSIGTSNDVCVLLHAADALYAGGHKTEALKLVCQAGRLARVKGYMGMVRTIATLGIL